MNVAVIAGYFPPEQSADSRLNQDLVESLAEHGMDVTLFVPFPTRGVARDMQAEYISKCDEQRSTHLHIIRIGKPGKYHQSLPVRALGFLRKSVQLYQAARKTDADVYLIVSTPPFLGYVAALLSRKKPVVYKLQDIFPDSLIHSKNLTEHNLMIRFLRKLERWVYRRVTKIIVSSDDMKTTLVHRGVPDYKISVIYDWIDEQKCYPVAKEDNPLIQKFQLSPEDFHVCYAGNIGFLQNIETIVKAAEQLETKAPGIQFLIIGDGAWKPQLDKLLSKTLHKNIHCFPMQPTDEIAAVYSLGDVGLVSLKPNVTRFALPSKTWDILSAGRPVICEIDPYSCLRGFIEENYCGYAVPPGDAETMAAYILDLYEHQDKARAMGRHGRTYIETYLTRRIAADQYDNQLREIICKGS